MTASFGVSVAQEVLCVEGAMCAERVDRVWETRFDSDVAAI